MKDLDYELCHAGFDFDSNNAYSIINILMDRLSISAEPMSPDEAIAQVAAQAVEMQASFNKGAT
jgi:hypothetical protein